ncbi:COX15/CtaA family protein [Amphritea sp. HPY]|uniref:COX15/CtaA family protein n=1 Tax=Amphritea sp. HPY TaxID=3421652 RepID=UPI003D7EF2E0
MLKQPVKHQAIWLTRLAIILALVVITLGGWTRLNDAGLSCPDWPGCFGKLVVPETSEEITRAEQEFSGLRVDIDKGWLEMTHRYAASGLGLVAMILVGVAGLNKDRKNYPFWHSVSLLLLVVIQGLFGMWTVTLKLLPIVVTLHLLGGLLTLALLIGLLQKLKLLRLSESEGYEISASRSKLNIALKPAKQIASVAVVLLFMQLALGGWTSTNYAGWSCTHWLYCQADIKTELDFIAGFNVETEIGPDYQGGMLPQPARAAIQMAHRVGGLIVAIALLLLIGITMMRHNLRKPASVLLLLLVIQLGLGIANVVLALPLLLAMAHHSGAVLLLLCLLWLKNCIEDTAPGPKKSG